MNIALLAERHPTLTVKNRRSHQVTIQYQNGDSVTIQPQAIQKIQSAGLSQIPNPVDIRMMSPRIVDLISEGILTTSDIGNIE